MVDRARDAELEVRRYYFAAITKAVHALTGERRYPALSIGLAALARGERPERPGRFLRALLRALRDAAQERECAGVRAREDAELERLRERTRRALHHDSVIS